MTNTAEYGVVTGSNEARYMEEINAHETWLAGLQKSGVAINGVSKAEAACHSVSPHGPPARCWRLRHVQQAIVDGIQLVGTGWRQESGWSSKGGCSSRPVVSSCCVFAFTRGLTLASLGCRGVYQTAEKLTPATADPRFSLWGNSWLSRKDLLDSELLLVGFKVAQ